MGKASAQKQPKQNTAKGEEAVRLWIDIKEESNANGTTVLTLDMWILSPKDAQRGGKGRSYWCPRDRSQ